MESTFNQLLKETVSPLLKAAGFNKTGMNYYRQLLWMVYLVNVQKSHGNSSVETGFYINCGMHSTVIDEAIDETPKNSPKEYECHYRTRIEALSNGAPPKFMVNARTDIPSLQAILRHSLSDVLTFFDAIPDTLSLVLYMAINGSERQYDIFRYCLRAGLQEEAIQLIGQTKRTYDSKRWNMMFAKMFKEIVEEEGSDLEVRW